MPPRVTRAPRADNRLPLILDEAARCFRAQGFHGTSVRDIVGAIDMLPGSLYYHFATKESLLAAVYAEGVHRISAAVTAAVAGKRDPWERLEAACIAHLEALLHASDYAQVVIRVLPADAPSVAAELDQAARRLRAAVRRARTGAAARARHRPPELPPHAARRAQLDADLVRRPGDAPGERRDTPRTIARRFVDLLREQLDPA